MRPGRSAPALTAAGDAWSLPDLTSLGMRMETSSDCFGDLVDSSSEHARGQWDDLRARYEADGYLLLRGLLDRDQVVRAGDEIVASLAERGLLDPSSPARDRVAAHGASVSNFGFEGEDRRFPDARRLATDGRMRAFYDAFLGSSARAFDYLWLRLMAPGQATPPHCDIVYMGRGTHELFTSWIPLSQVTVADGPLMVLERSHRIAQIREGYAKMDIDRDGNWRKLKFRHGRLFRGGDYSRNPRRVREEFGLRWLTAEFEPGDVVVFSPFTMHGSLDNRSPRFRISIDARYQRAADPIDERWIGERPIAHSRAE